MVKTSFVHIHLHSEYSERDSISKIYFIAKRIKELGQTAFAITDHGTTTGLLDGYKTAKKEGLKFIFGCEFYFTPDITIKDRDLLYHLVILAKNKKGYENLLKLDSIAWDNQYYKPRIDLNILKQYSDGLIVTSACIGGILSRDDAEYWAKQFKDIFKEDYYLEIHTNQMPEQKEYNYKILKLSEKLNIPIVAAVDSHYIKKEDAAIHRKWKLLADDSEYYTTNDYYIMSRKEVIECFTKQGIDLKYIYKAINNTVKIASECNVDIEFGGQNYPVFNVDNQKEAILEICREGWRKKIIPFIPKEKRDIYLKRFLHELDLLEKLNYFNYFLITYDIHKFCELNNIRTGVGRGSVVGSLVAYLMNLTKLDPIKYNLIFERFAHLERVTPPDIDNDIEQSKRQQVIQYIKQKYGENRVYQVRTINYMGIKAALQRAGQALKIKPSTVDKLSKNISSLGEINGYPELVELARKFSLDNVIDENGKKVKGIIQNYGIHASAVVVFPDEPTHWCAIERTNNVPVAASDYHLLEEQGILKLDILGLKTLDVIQNTLNLIPDKVDIDHLPEEDEKTFDLLCRGKTLGVFQLESKGMTQLVVDMQPRSYKDLIPLVALYRPGTLNAGMVDTFVKRRRGEERIVYLHPKLEPILADTYGVILYQEQIMEIVQTLAGWTLGKADNLRRIIGRKVHDEMQPQIDQFIEDCVSRGIDRSKAKQIAEQIVTFADYGFNKSHSAAYGYIAYQTAYLKAHYPLEYMCSLINSEGGEQEKIIPYIQECKNMGIKILPPDLRYSKPQWTIEGNNLRIGLTYIKGIGQIDTNFNSYTIEDIYKRYNKRILESLVKSGSLDFLGNRKELYSLIEPYLKYFKDKNQYQQRIEFFTQKKNQKKVEEWTKKLSLLKPPLPREIEFDEVAGEIETLSFTLRDPLELYDLSLCNGSTIIGGIVTKFKQIKDKKGRDMAFVTVRTTNGNRELVMFASNYKQLFTNRVYLFGIDGNKIIEVKEAKKR